LAKWQIGKLAKSANWQNCKILSKWFCPKWQNGKMAKWQIGKIGKIGKLAKWQNFE
jgi:hypothetical protein